MSFAFFIIKMANMTTFMTVSFVRCRMNIKIATRKLVPSYTMCFLRVNRSKVIIHQYMFAICNRLKMFRINTGRVVTNMMKMFSFWNRSIFKNITKPVSHISCRFITFPIMPRFVDTECSVSGFSDITCPLPASIRKNYIISSKIFFRGSFWYSFFCHNRLTIKWGTILSTGKIKNIITNMEIEK